MSESNKCPFSADQQALMASKMKSTDGKCPFSEDGREFVMKGVTVTRTDTETTGDKCPLSHEEQQAFMEKMQKS